MSQLDDGLSPRPLTRVVPQSQASEHIATFRWVALLVVAGIVSAVAVWVISPRFAIDTPSLVDDWSAIARSEDQLAEALRLSNPERQRFRPGWIAWNYVQWHTLGAPRELVGPNVWNVVRVVVFVAGLSLLTLLAMPVPVGRREAVLQAALAGAPAVVVIATPKFAVDLARFGPQEPLLLGAMALGGSLLVLAAQALLDPGSLSAWRTALLVGVGGLVWALGVYQKETSLAVLPLLVAVLIVGRERLRRWGRLGRARQCALVAIGLAAAVPLAHVVVESARIMLRGDLVYDARVDRGQGMVDGVRELYEWAHEALPRHWQLWAGAAVALTVLVAVGRRRIDWLAVGVLASAAVALSLAGQAGVVATRYYLPVFALLLVALSLALARLPSPIQVVVLIGLAVTLVTPRGGHAEVRAWSDREQQTSSFVQAVADLESSGCRIAAAGLGPEEAQALPVVIGVLRPEARETCDEPTATYLVVGAGREGAALVRACAPAAFTNVEEVPERWLFRCDDLRTTPVRDPTFGIVMARRLVVLRGLEVPRA